MRSVRSAGMVLALIACVATGCGGGEGPGRVSDRGDRTIRLDEDPTRLRVEQVERFAQIELPDSTRSLDAVRRKGFQGETLSASFVIARSDLDEFIRRARFRQPPEDGLRTVFGNEDLGSGVDDAKRILGTSDVIPGVGRNVLVDLDRPGTAIVYLDASTT